MNTLNHPPQTCAGCDIAKDEIVIASANKIYTIANKKIYTIANKNAAIRTFLIDHAPQLVICEPTGGFEHLLLQQCVALGVNVHRVDTLKVKAFIRSLGQLGKTDALDASALARYGVERWQDLNLWKPHDKDMDNMRALVLRRNDLVAIRVAETNRLKAPTSKPVATSIKTLIKDINRQIINIEKAINTLIEENDKLKEKVAICTAMDGVGLRTAAALLALMPELGSLTRRKAASLAGLAPHPNESGATIRRRTTRGGRPHIAKSIYMSALRAAGGKGEFALFYKRLIENGKKPIVAITAVMRKIIITLNARLRDHMKLQS